MAESSGSSDARQDGPGGGGEARESGGAASEARVGYGGGQVSRGSGWFALFGAAVMVTLFLLFFDTVSTILLLFILAAAIGALLRPVAAKLTRRRETLVGGLLGAAFWLGGVVVLAVMAGVFASELQGVMRRWPEIERALDNTLGSMLERLGLEPVTLEEVVTGLLEWLAAGETGALLPALADWTGAILVALALIVFGSIFMLSSHAGHTMRPVLARLPRRHRVSLLRAFQDLEVGLRGWLLGLMASMGIVGLLSFVGFSILGLDLALPLAVFAGLAELVPFLGPTIAFALIALFALTEGTFEFIGVLVIWAVVQVVEPYVLVPMIMRRAVKIPPLVTLFTVILWARIFGPLGLFMAIPINLTIWAFVDRFVVQSNRRERGP